MSMRYARWANEVLHKLRRETQAWWQRLIYTRDAYRKTFDLSQPHVRLVLQDLERECYGVAALPTDDPIKMAEAVGANRVLKRIIHFTNTTPDVLYEIHKERLRE